MVGLGRKTPPERVAHPLSTDGVALDRRLDGRLEWVEW